MKALLIFPPNQHIITTNIPEFLEEETGVYPPLGLMYVASYAQKHTDWKIQIMDCIAQRINYSNMEEKIKSINPDVVGICTLTFTLIDAIMTARIVKRINPSIHICLGGPHVNIYPQETIMLDAVDSLILGEGEKPFSQLLNSLAGNKQYHDFPGVVYKNKDNKVINNGFPALIKDLDSLPHPDRKMTSFKNYHSVLGKETFITTMMSSRGCPAKCIFCDRPHLGKSFRARSPENVVEEMEECRNLDIDEIIFYDDTFTINKKRVIDICELILKKNISVKWDVRARVDTVDEKVLQKMKAAGCIRIHYGVESGSEKVLKILRKNLNLQSVKKIFSYTKSIGIETLGYFMIGCPGEGPKETKETLDFMLKLPADFVHISIATPFPGTEMYRMGLENGILKKDIWKEFALNPNSDFSPDLWTEYYSKEELYKLLGGAYHRFYARPGYILNQLKKVKSPAELMRKIGMGTKLLLRTNSHI